MPVPAPELDDLATISQRWGLDIDDSDLAVFKALIEGALGAYQHVDAMYEASAPDAPQRPNRRPADADNQLGAWYWHCDLQESDSGPLAGRTVAVKDNTAVAGVPMMNGSRILEGYVPRRDATVVTRILEAGGRILGKSACEDLCFSGASHTCATGVIRNPWDTARTSGGSSGGSGALVAAGEVDMAIAGDQGGSIRMPSAWCGVVGLKPTFGLVPYTGAYPIESTIDHLGPIARNISDLAAFLTVIAGPDGNDPRQAGAPSGIDYAAGIDDGIEGLRVGVVAEGFGFEGLSDPDSDAKVEAAAHRLADAGAVVERISIPEHLDALHVWNVIATDGAMWQMIRGNGYGMNYRGLFDPELMEHTMRGWRAGAHETSHTLKFVMLCAEHVFGHSGGGSYARASNVRAQISAAVEDALHRCDVLCYPTLPFPAKEIPAADAPVDEYVARALEMIPNTAVSNVTGNPDLTIPVAGGDGMPVGMSIVGGRWSEPVLLRVGRAYERLVGGFALSPMAAARLE
ncbi:amidase [Candidatus Poriferisodalis sp.]|uniref:amidase n=1 Tax=Candidatus Poriferisodalis sp. TaxID=3101277 RepID=UPI003B01EFE2